MSGSEESGRVHASWLLEFDTQSTLAHTATLIEDGLAARSTNTNPG